MRQAIAILLFSFIALLAEPAAIMIAQAAFSAAEELGMPEVRIPLAHAAIYVACCPKSNSAYLAVDAALDVRLSAM